MYHVITNQKKEEIVKWISDRVDFKVRNKERVKCSREQQPAYYMEEKLIEIQGEIDELNYHIRDYNTALSKNDTSSR